MPFGSAVLVVSVDRGIPKPRRKHIRNLERRKTVDVDPADTCFYAEDVDHGETAYILRTRVTWVV